MLLLCVVHRQRMEGEYAQLRIENQKLKSELNNKHRFTDIQQQQQHPVGKGLVVGGEGYGYNMPQQQPIFASPPPTSTSHSRVLPSYIPDKDKDRDRDRVDHRSALYQTLAPVIVPEKIWRGGPLWKIPFNGKVSYHMIS